MKNNVKILAFHLPQFHTFPENDQWWGEGFTEWVNVKKAKPLYEGHNQPRIPLNGYYNMLDYETRKRQADLASQYNIEGFCYYHYWFNGKLLMEKPLEMLLNEKEISLPFCFCWANENWTRAWDGNNSEILISQDYGNKEDWNKHIDYLLKFFLDERYIKIDNKPMIVIYRTKDIPYIDEMIAMWNNKCIENGFDGIYVVEELNGFQNKSYVKSSSALVDFEPGYTQRFNRSIFLRFLNKIREVLKRNNKRYILFDYDKIWKKIIKRNFKNISNKEIFLGAFVDWDNSPRRKSNAKIFINGNVNKFQKYFSDLYKKAQKNNCKYIFINAWNEWAEGTYLEPDQANKYGYLESIKNIVSK